MDVLNFPVEFYRTILRSGLKVFLVIIIALIALKAVRLVSKRFVDVIKKNSDDDEVRKRTDTLTTVSRHFVSVLIISVAGMMVLDNIGINIGPVLAAAGIVGVAVGFGAQSLIKDVINGFFILLEDQIRVGDVIEAGGKSGLVEKVNLRMTVLRDLAGKVYFIPNSAISIVTNMTKEFSRYIFEVGITYDQNLDQAMAAMREVDVELRQDPGFRDDITVPLEILGLDQFADSSVIIKAHITTKPIQQWRVGREYNRRLKEKFDSRGIEFPFPTRTVYMPAAKNAAEK